VEEEAGSLDDRSENGAREIVADISGTVR